MGDEIGDAEKPGDLPEDVARRIAALSYHELRLAVDYAQAVLAERHGGPPEIEPLPGEEIVSIAEHEGYTEVVKRQPCAEGCAECPHGPYLYHVTRETHPDNQQHLKWRYLGTTHVHD